MKKLLAILILLILTGCQQPKVEKEPLLGGTGTLGYTTEATYDINNTLAPDTIRTWAYTMTENGTVTSISFYTGATNVGYDRYWRPVIYKASDMSLVTYGAQETIPNNSALAWHTTNVTPVALVSGTAYRIGAWVDSAGATGPGYIFDQGQTMYRDNHTYHATDVPVNPLVDEASTADVKASIYATYTTEESPPASTSTSNPTIWWE